jgi:hypothetical protein
MSTYVIENRRLPDKSLIVFNSKPKPVVCRKIHIPYSNLNNYCIVDAADSVLLPDNKSSIQVSQNWLPRENRHVPTTKETLN